MLELELRVTITININQPQKPSYDVAVSVEITVWDLYHDFSFFIYNYRDSVNQREKRVLAPLSSRRSFELQKQRYHSRTHITTGGRFTERRLKPRWRGGAKCDIIPDELGYGYLRGEA
ncbi:hypothetical protein AVEN_27595-1 [Araneus ventricosus]|uniref:Uncharacterized protein n=1 Tax=Araneus ventricosus TaxID=182803 RepID=A0A4Y2W0I9_ARAVE|nr:hypothetical protein AVEN_27595-1 [Araneus ventricosus]